MLQKWIKIIIFSFALAPANATAQNIIIDGMPVIDDVLDERLIIAASEIPNYRDEARKIIITIDNYLEEKKSDFIVAVKGGEELLTKGEWEQNLLDLQAAEKNNDLTDEEVFLSNMFNPEPPTAPVGSAITPYLNSIDAWFATNLVCANTPANQTTENILQKYNIPIFSAELCMSRENNARYPFGYINSREFSNAEPINNNPDNIFTMNDARNIFFLKKNNFYETKDQEIEAIRNNNYDVIVINPFFKEKIAFNKSEIDKMKVKKIGGKRLVLAYFNIAVISEKMYFWKQDWGLSSPYWIRLSSPFSEDEFVVEYWDDNWKKIIDDFLKSVMQLGYDGIFIDGLDYHYLFEKLTPA